MKREMPKVIIDNPEAIEIAKERFTKCAYELYMQSRVNNKHNQDEQAE
jgi:hypothetical protein